MRATHGDERRIAALNGNDCRSKIRHSSKRHALAAGRVILDREQLRRRDDNVLNAYRCRQCHAWHLGNSPRRLVRDAAAIAGATEMERRLAAALEPYL